MSPAASRLALAAVVAIGLFAVCVVILHFLPTGFNPSQSPISYYADGPFGWLMVPAFLGLGGGSLLLALAIKVGLPPAASSRAGLLLLTAWGGSRFLAAVFTADLPGATPTLHGGFHALLFLIAVLSIGPSAILFGLRFRRQASWRPIAVPSLGLGSIALAVAPLLIVILVPGFFGLIQRGFYGVSIAWLFLMAWCLRASVSSAALA
jgi:uncharacterized protein DUF998